MHSIQYIHYTYIKYIHVYNQSAHGYYHTKYIHRIYTMRITINRFITIPPAFQQVTKGGQMRALGDVAYSLALATSDR